MHNYEPEKILEAVASLKEIKASSFSIHDGPIDFQNVMETCRIIDTLMLPLYYIWENCCHKQLEDISFEEHLRKPYQRFVLNPITYTWELYIFVTLKELIFKQLAKDDVFEEITFIYKELIDDYKMAENAIPK